jgi:hypothetical protein
MLHPGLCTTSLEAVPRAVPLGGLPRIIGRTHLPNAVVGACGRCPNYYGGLLVSVPASVQHSSVASGRALTLFVTATVHTVMLIVWPLAHSASISDSLCWGCWPWHGNDNLWQRPRS